MKPLDWKGKSRSSFTPTVIGSVLVLLANPRRIGATFVNNSGNIMFLCKGELAVIGSGIPLYGTGGAYEINLTNPYYGPISVACGVAAQNLAWTEDE